VEPDFWHERWQSKEIGFHQAAYHDLMQKHWPELGLGPGSQVFVPLCGKSLDMVWLAGAGHRVIGAELSRIAVEEFFAERSLAPQIEAAGGFSVYRAGPYEIWCGDFFELPRSALAEVEGVYDRASLVAFPPEMQERYAATLTGLMPERARMLLVTLDYDQSQMAGPPFAVSREQVRRLFGDRFAITEVAARSGIPKNPQFVARGLSSLEECVYVLRRR
jgi:thiopurine S-methyltransferase